MTGLEFTLDGIHTVVKLGQSIDSVRKVFGPEDSYMFLEDVQCDYLSYEKLGLEFLLTEKKLSTLFIYIEHENFDSYVGQVEFLDNEFFNRSSMQSFYEAAVLSGYVEWASNRETSVDLIKNDIRLRYTSSPHRGDFITYSNWNHLIKSISEPINVNGLLDMMMKRFDETLAELGSFQVSKQDYESRCRSLIKRFELGSKLAAHT